MPRPKRHFHETINVPVPRALKRRVELIAERQTPDALKPTTIARRYIEQGVVRDEKALGISRELISAK